MTRRLQVHVAFLLGLALFAMALLVSMSRGARAMLGVIGSVMFISGAVLQLLLTPDAVSDSSPETRHRWSALKIPESRLLTYACAAGATVCAGVIWAAVSGHGLGGRLESAHQLDRSATFPDANAIFFAGVAGYGLATCVAALSSKYSENNPVSRAVFVRWFGLTALVGALLAVPAVVLRLI